VSGGKTLSRWRLILGKTADQLGIGADDSDSEASEVLDYLFSPTGSGGGRDGGGRTGGLGPGHSFSVPAWIDAVNRLFPREAKEVLEREFVDRRGLGELLEHPKLLEKVEPNVELVKTLLTHRDLLNEKTRGLARKLIQQVVQQLKDKLKIQVVPAITGALRRDRHSPRKVFRNLDLKTTLRRNLQNWDADEQRLLVDQTYYFAAERNRRPWHIIVAVDQSGSMLESAVFSSVMASIFYELPSVRTSLFLFDTEIADLSDQVGQPVDVLLQVQLGGGTHIAQALRYGAGLVREPARTILVLITDFYEGGPENDLVDVTRALAESGVRMIGLGALGYDARPFYNRHTAKKLRKVGMDILVCTPEKLADCMAEIIRG